MKALVVSPVDGCALANMGVRWYGADRNMFRCPMCEGEPISHYGSLVGICDQCGGSGVVLPDGPTTMLLTTTSTTPKAGRIGSLQIVPPSSVVTNGQWIAQQWEGHTCMARFPILPAHVLGTVTFEALPIAGNYKLTAEHERRHVCVDLSDGVMYLHDGDDSLEPIVDTPFGSWKPGDVALHITDFTPTIECPEPTTVQEQCPTCGGLGAVLGLEDERPCPACEGACFVESPWAGQVTPFDIGRLSCPLPWSGAPAEPCITTIDTGSLT